MSVMEGSDSEPELVGVPNETLKIRDSVAMSI